MIVLCVDPSPDARRETLSALSEAGFETVPGESLADARDALGTTPIEGVVTEYDLPDGTGLELVALARESAPDATCVLFTGAGFEGIDTAALGDTILEYVDKGAPGARAELVDLLAYGLETRFQTAYPLPDDEDARLAALGRYADDPAALDAEFDGLTTVAAALFDVDAATVGFVEDHHERFVACYGTDIDRLDREDTVCTYTILDDATTAVPDLHEDPRFRDNEAIEAQGIRFYAGAPVRTPDGEAIGVFCLFDTEPRSFDDRDRELLELLADEVMERLDLRYRLRMASGNGSESGDEDEHADGGVPDE